MKMLLKKIIRGRCNVRMQASRQFLRGVHRTLRNILLKESLCSLKTTEKEETCPKPSRNNRF